MRLFDWLALLIILTLVIDYVESSYFLNNFGFQHELNDNITNNKSLTYWFVFKLVITLFCLAIISGFIDSGLIVNLEYYVELVLVFVLGFNFAIVFKNLMIIL